MCLPGTTAIPTARSPHLLDPTRKGMRNNQKLGPTATLSLVGLWGCEASLYAHAGLKTTHIDSPRNVRAYLVTKGFWQSSEKRTVCNKCKPILLTDGKPL